MLSPSSYAASHQFLLEDLDIDLLEELEEANPLIRGITHTYFYTPPGTPAWKFAREKIVEKIEHEYSCTVISDMNDHVISPYFVLKLNNYENGTDVEGVIGELYEDDPEFPEELKELILRSHLGSFDLKDFLSKDKNTSYASAAAGFHTYAIDKFRQRTLPLFNDDEDSNSYLQPFVTMEADKLEAKFKEFQDDVLDALWEHIKKIVDFYHKGDAVAFIHNNDETPTIDTPVFYELYLDRDRDEGGDLDWIYCNNESDHNSYELNQYYEEYGKVINTLCLRLQRLQDAFSDESNINRDLEWCVKHILKKDI
jgi:hypothetical protein